MGEFRAPPHPRDGRGHYRGYDAQRGLYEKLPEQLWAAYGDAVRLTASAMERIGHEAMKAGTRFARLARIMRIDAAERRSEAAIRLFHRTYSPRLLWVAMREAFHAEWLRASA